MCLKKHKTCCSSSDHHFWSFWRITSISICITIITISTSFISFTKCFTSFSRFQPFHWSGFTGFPTFTLSCICPSFTSDKLSTSPCFSYQVPLQRVGSTHTLSTLIPPERQLLTFFIPMCLYHYEFAPRLIWQIIKWVKCVKTFLKDCHVRHKNHTESPKKDVKIASCSLLDLSHWVGNAIIGAVKRMGWWVVPKRKRIKS